MRSEKRYEYLAHFVTLLALGEDKAPKGVTCKRIRKIWNVLFQANHIWRDIERHGGADISPWVWSSDSVSENRRRAYEDCKANFWASVRELMQRKGII